MNMNLVKKKKKKQQNTTPHLAILKLQVRVFLLLK